MTTFSSPRRSDYAALRVVLVLAPLIALLTGVLPGLIGAVTGAPLRWRGQVGDEATVLAPISTTGGATARFDGGVMWTIPDPIGWQRALALVPGLEITALVTLAAWCLWKLLTRVRSGDAFGGDAVNGVRGLAVLVICYGILVKVTRILLDFLITSPVQPEPAAYFQVTPASVLPIVLGLLLLVLAECFRQGSRLRADVEGLV